MLNPFKDVNWNPGAKERRSFARSLVIGFPCVALLLLGTGWWRTGAWNFPMAAKVGGIGALAGVVFWILPVLAKPFYVVWYFIACCMGVVMGNVLMALVFYVFVLPVGLVMRLVGRRPIQKKPDHTAPTYWQDVRPPADAKSYFHQY